MGSTARTWMAALALAIVVIIAPAAVRAQSEKATAEALFNDGRKLMGEKKYAEACEKFQKSQEIDPAVGTLLNLGDCFEKSGKMASAWSRYKEAENLAAKLKDKRDRDAAARAASVEPKVSRLTINVGDEAKQANPKVTRDGADVRAALWGAPILVDSGKHLIVVSAAGKKDFTKEVDVAEGASTSVDVPALEAGESAPAAAPAAAPTTTEEPKPAPPPEDTKKGGSSQKTWALVAGGIGVVGIAVGTVLALGAKSKFDDAKSHCKDGTTQCDDEAAKLSKDARSQGNIATIAWGVGIVGVATGAVLWFTAPKSSEQATTKRAKRRVAVAPIVTHREAGIWVSGALP